MLDLALAEKALEVAIISAPVVLTLSVSSLFEWLRKMPLIGTILSCWWCTSYWTCGVLYCFMSTSFFNLKFDLLAYSLSLVFNALIFAALYHIFMSAKFYMLNRR